MIDANLVFPFGAGMLATVNPCGFALLPAYLSFFVGQDDPDSSKLSKALPRAIAVGIVMTLGFVLVFGVVGAGITKFSLTIREQLPWATVVIGIGLIGLGLAFFLGKQIALKGPKLNKGGESRQFSSMFLFGVSYAIASLSCTLGPFLAATTSTFNNGNFISGVAVFIFYALGMGSVITILTVAMAFAKSSILTYVRKALPYINRISGVLLILSGAYVAYYGWFEIRQQRNPLVQDPIINGASRIQSNLTNWLSSVSPTVAGYSAAALIAIVLVTYFARRNTGART